MMGLAGPMNMMGGGKDELFPKRTMYSVQSGQWIGYQTSQFNGINSGTLSGSLIPELTQIALIYFSPVLSVTFAFLGDVRAQIAAAGVTGILINGVKYNYSPTAYYEPGYYTYFEWSRPTSPFSDGVTYTVQFTGE